METILGYSSKKPKMGDSLKELSGINSVIDFFANVGSGGVLTIAHAQKISGGNKAVYTTEWDSRLEHDLKINLEGYPTVNLLMDYLI